MMNKSTSYYERLACELAAVFYERIPYNILDIKLGLKPEQKRNTDKDLVGELQQLIAEIH